MSHIDAPALQAAPVRTLQRKPIAALVLQLHDVAWRISRADPSAGALLGALVQQLRDHPDPRSTGLMVFAQALAERRADASAEAANLYLRRFEVPQIDLFNLLGRQVPLARMATRIANEVLAQAIQGDPHPTLIDVGMGTGRQFSALLDDLAAAGTLPPAMTLIGIEPAAEALAQARDVLHAQARQLGMALQFVGFAAAAEALGEAGFELIADACSAPPVINAAFALHHIADDPAGRDRRHLVLARLRALKPRCLVVTEPDVDHLEPRFFERFRNCFAHFGAVFRMLDALPLAQAERDALKVGFFGREILDMLGTPEPLRSERHESTAAWLQRLQRAGFATRPAAVELPASGHPAVSARQRGSHIALAGGPTPLVSVIVARPRADAMLA